MADFGDTNPARWRACCINHEKRPWAIISPDGPFGDEIVAGNLSERDAKLLVSAARICHGYMTCAANGGPVYEWRGGDWHEIEARQ